MALHRRRPRPPTAGRCRRSRRARAVDHAANGFNPTDDPARLRLRARRRKLRERPRPARVGDRRRSTRRSRSRPASIYPAWTYNGRVPGPTLRCTEGDAAADPLRQRLRASAHDPLPRHPPGVHGRHAGHRRGRGGGQIEPGRAASSTSSTPSPFGLHLYHCHVSPLADAHRRAASTATFIIDPKRRPRRTPTRW